MSLLLCQWCGLSILLRATIKTFIIIVIALSVKGSSAYFNGFHALVLHRKHGQVFVLLQGPADLLVVHQVVRPDQQQTETLSGGAGGSAAAVDVRLRRARNLNPR